MSTAGTSEQEDALRALFALPRSVPLTWRETAGPPDWHVYVRVGDGPHPLEFDVSRTAPDGRWFVGVHFAVSYRWREDGVRPSVDPEVASLMNRVRDRLRVLDARGLLGPWGRIAAAFGWVTPGPG